MYELVIIWSDGEKTIEVFDTEEQALKGADNMRFAFGSQIQWVGVRKAVNK